MHSRNTYGEKQAWRGALSSGMTLPAGSKQLTVATFCLSYALPSLTAFCFLRFAYVLALNSQDQTASILTSQ